MAYNWICLTLADDGKNTTKLITQRETAEYFGWDTAFPEWNPRIRVLDDGGRRVSYQSAWAGSNHGRGGKRLVICRHKSTGGSPRGMTHCFRIKGNFSNSHLRLMAEVAGDRFEWMETKYHERRRREAWLRHGPDRTD